MRTLRILLIGFLLGVIVTTAAQVWGWGHTAQDRAATELQKSRERDELRDQRDMIDRTLKRPC